MISFSQYTNHSQPLAAAAVYDPPSPLHSFGGHSPPLQVVALSPMVGRDSVEPLGHPSNKRLDRVSPYQSGRAQPTKVVESFISRGLVATSAVAGDGRDAALGVARRGAIEDETPVGLLDFPAQQRALGRLGLAGARLRANRSSIRSRVPQYSRRGQKRARLTL